MTLISDQGGKIDDEARTLGVYTVLGVAHTLDVNLVALLRAPDQRARRQMADEAARMAEALADMLRRMEV